MSAPNWPTPEQAAAAAADQEAATLAGIEETAAARGIAVPSPATGAPSSPPAPSPTEAVRDHSLLLQRAKLISEGGMTKAEADAWYAEMTGQPVPVVDPAAVPAATGKHETASRESFPVDTLAASPMDRMLQAGRTLADGKITQAQYLRIMTAEDLVAPIAMTDEEMAAAVTRVRAAKSRIENAEAFVSEAEAERAAAFEEWLAAKRAVVAGVAALTEEP